MGEKVCKRFAFDDTFQQVPFAENRVQTMVYLRLACVWLLNFYLSAGCDSVRVEQIGPTIICMQARECPSHTGPLVSAGS